MYQGFSAEINILDTRKAEKCSKLTKMAQFNHFGGARIRKILISAQKTFIHYILYYKTYNISTIYI